MRPLILVLILTSSAHAGVDLPALIKAAPTCDPARAHCIGLKLHIAVGDQGAVASADWITMQLSRVNHHFAAIDTGFQITAVADLPASAVRIEDAKERHSLAPRVGGTVIDVFVTGQLDDIDIKGEIIYGVAWPAGNRKFIIISTMAWQNTLTHELGHVFGLPHSSYAVSLMNKTDRKEPPYDKRTFHEDELASMRLQLKRLLRDKIIANLAAKKP